MSSFSITEEERNMLVEELKDHYEVVLVETELGIDENTRSFKMEASVIADGPDDKTILNPLTFQLEDVKGVPVKTYLVRGNVIDEKTFSVRAFIQAGTIIKPVK